MAFTPTPLRDDGKPQIADWWNILLFAVLTLVMGYLFNVYIIKPREAALVVHAQQEQAAQADAAIKIDPIPMPRPRDEVVASGARVNMGNKDVTATIAVDRPRLDDIAFKNYYTTIEKTDPVRILTPLGTANPAYAETGWLVDGTAKIKTPGADTHWIPALDNNDARSSFTWDNGQGLVFTRTIQLDEHYMFTITDRVQNMGSSTVTLYPYALLTQHGVPEDHQTGVVHEGAIGYIGNQYVTENYKNWAALASTPKQIDATSGWVGITSRYFFAGLIPDQNEKAQYRVTYRGIDNPADKNAKARYQVDVQGAARVIEPGKLVTSSVHVFTGPKVLRQLETYEKQLGLKHFDLVVDFGWFYFLTKPFYYALTFIYSLVGNFGVAILLFTLLLRAAVFPLANTSFKSFAKMKQVSPQIQELQKTYINDKKKMQEELIKLYTREKVNPMSGCLPILAQIPIFFAMYKVISVAIEMRQAPFFGWIHDLTAPDPTSIFNLYGLLPYDVHSMLHFGLWPTFLFCMIMLQVRLSPPPADKMMQIFFNYYYPVIVCFIMAKFAAGLVIYWTFSAFLSVAQQMIIMTRMGVPIHLFEKFKKDKPVVEAEPKAE